MADRVDIISSLRKLSPVNTVLIIVAVVIAAVAYFAWQAKVDAQQEKDNALSHYKSVEVSLSLDDRRATLEELQKKLADLRSTPIESPLLSREDAVAVTALIPRYAQESGVNITGWTTNDRPIAHEGKDFPCIQHEFVVQADADGLIGFIDSLNASSTGTVINNVEIARSEAGAWEMSFVLNLYYSEG